LNGDSLTDLRTGGSVDTVLTGSGSGVCSFCAKRF